MAITEEKFYCNGCNNVVPISYFCQSTNQLSANVKLIQPKINNDAIDLCEKVLADLKSGYAQSLTVMVEYNNKTYMVQGSTAQSRLETVGILVEAIFNRLEAK